MNTKCASCGKPLPPRSVAENPNESLYCRACAMKMLEGHSTSRTETRVAIQSELQNESMADVYGPGSTQNATMSNGPRWVSLRQDRNPRKRTYSTGRKIAGASIFLGTTVYGAIILALAFNNRPVPEKAPTLAQVVHQAPAPTPAPPAPAPVIPAPPPQETPAAPVITPETERPTDNRDNVIAMNPQTPAETPIPAAPTPTYTPPPAPTPTPAPAPAAPAYTPPPAPAPAPTPAPTIVDSTPKPPAPPANRKATTNLTAPDEVGGGEIKLSVTNGVISNITPGAWARWDNVDFGANGSIASIRLMMKIASPDHKIDVRLDDPESGPVIATLQTNSPTKDFAPIIGSIDDVSGKHSVYLVFGNFDSGEIQSMTFLAEATAAKAVKPVVIVGPRMSGQNPPASIKTVDVAITATKANAAARFDKVEFGNAPGYRTMLLGVRATAPNQKITIKLDDAAKGRTLATVNIPAGNKPTTLSVVITGAPVTGTHSLFVIFAGTATHVQTITFRP